MQTIVNSLNNKYRILQLIDDATTIEDLKGDTYKPETNPTIDPAVLRKEEKAFEELCATEGIFGYALERWNSTPNIGYETVDSCFGFVGPYNENNLHYIVAEYRNTIAKMSAKDDAQGQEVDTFGADVKANEKIHQAVALIKEFAGPDFVLMVRGVRVK